MKLDQSCNHHRRPGGYAPPKHDKRKLVLSNIPHCQSSIAPKLKKTNVSKMKVSTGLLLLHVDLCLQGTVCSSQCVPNVLAHKSEVILTSDSDKAVPERSAQHNHPPCLTLLHPHNPHLRRRFPL